MDIQFIRRLAELLQKTDLDEIEVVEGESKVRITRHQPVTQSFHPPVSDSSGRATRHRPQGIQALDGAWP